MIKLIDILSEIVVKGPSPRLDTNTTEFVKDYIINYIKDNILIDSEIGDILDIYFDREIYDITHNFISEQMIHNNYELYKNNDEILVSYNNRDIVDEDDIRNYIDEHPNLEKYLKKLIFNFYWSQIDISELYSKSMLLVRNYMDKWEIKDIINDILENAELYLEYILEDTYGFGEYIRREFLKSDLINEIKITNNPYPEKTIGWWLMKLPQPYRSQALNNWKKDDTYEKYKNLICRSKLDALGWAFLWKNTLEGKDYWDNISYKLSNDIPLDEIKITNPNHITADKVRDMWNEICNKFGHMNGGPELNQIWNKMFNEWKPIYIKGKNSLIQKGKTKPTSVDVINEFTKDELMKSANIFKQYLNK